jgi:nucleoside-triphosphatase THEP1
MSAGAAGPRLFVITGERGAGKSVVCSRLAALLLERGVALGGIVTERGPLGEGRVAIDLANGERRPFGRQEFEGSDADPRGPSTAGSDASEPDTVAPGAADPLTPSWRYDEEVFRWGNEVFDRAGDRDVLIVDELGPVEILGGRGWVRALERVKAGDNRDAVVVCRPGLLKELTSLVGSQPDAVFEVTLATREDLPAAIAAALDR